MLISVTGVAAVREQRVTLVVGDRARTRLYPRNPKQSWLRPGENRLGERLEDSLMELAAAGQYVRNNSKDLAYP